MLLNKLKTSTYCFLIIICFSAISVFAQETQETSNDNVVFDKKHVLFKFSPLSMVEPDATFQLGVEYIFKPRMGFQQNIGYIFARPYYGGVFSNPGIETKGIRSRSEMKFYINRTEKERPIYVSTELMYKFVQIQTTELLEYPDDSESYWHELEINRKVIGFAPKFGFMNNFPKHKFVFDMSIGVGMKAIFYENNLPADAELVHSTSIWGWGISSDNPSGTATLPTVLVSIQIGFGR